MEGVDDGRTGLVQDAIRAEVFDVTTMGLAVTVSVPTVLELRACHVSLLLWVALGAQRVWESKVRVRLTWVVLKVLVAWER